MTDPAAGAERRVNPGLRTVFADVCEMLRPFFDPANDWSGQGHEHLAYRRLHEAFPGLSHQEVFTLVAAARRVFGATGKPPSP